MRFYRLYMIVCIAVSLSQSESFQRLRGNDGDASDSQRRLGIGGAGADFLFDGATSAFKNGAGDVGDDLFRTAQKRGAENILDGASKKSPKFIDEGAFGGGNDFSRLRHFQQSTPDNVPSVPKIDSFVDGNPSRSMNLYGNQRSAYSASNTPPHASSPSPSTVEDIPPLLNVMDAPYPSAPPLPSAGVRGDIPTNVHMKRHNMFVRNGKKFKRLFRRRPHPRPNPTPENAPPPNVMDAPYPSAPPPSASIGGEIPTNVHTKPDGIFVRNGKKFKRLFRRRPHPRPNPTPENAPPTSTLGDIPPSGTSPNGVPQQPHTVHSFGNAAHGSRPNPPNNLPPAGYPTQGGYAGQGMPANLPRPGYAAHGAPNNLPPAGYSTQGGYAGQGVPANLPRPGYAAHGAPNNLPPAGYSTQGGYAGQGVPANLPRPGYAAHGAPNNLPPTGYSTEAVSASGNAYPAMQQAGKSHTKAYALTGGGVAVGTLGYVKYNDDELKEDICITKGIGCEELKKEIYANTALEDSSV